MPAKRFARRKSSWGSRKTNAAPGVETDSAQWAKSFVERIAATPRFAASESERSARTLCRDRLRQAGFETHDEEFSFSQVPARLGPFICGTIFAGGVFLSGHVAAAERRPLTGIAIAVGAAIFAGITGFFLMRSIAALPAWRLTSSNLVAVRGGMAEQPKVWLVAHIDTKSQTIRMLVRVGSMVAASMLFALTIGAMILQSARMSDELALLQSAYAALFTAIAIVPFALCFITNKSRGALDNASGIAATLLAVEAIPRDRNIGVLISSAEELGLAGAHAFAARRDFQGIAINCDTIDDAGRFICMKSGSKTAARSAMQRAAEHVAVPVRVRGTIPGVLTDSVALAQAGWDTCTLSRGNLRTLARVHTSGDEPGRIDGTGIALAARVLAATVEELT